MTFYTISIGYNSTFTKEQVSEKLLSTVREICSNPECLLLEAKAGEGRNVPLAYVEPYKMEADLQWPDLTLRVNYDDNNLPEVVQFASASGNSRGYKETMRRAFCRLVMQKMHWDAMEVNIDVA